MADVDQRRINHQSSDFLSARAAAKLLDVKPQTLYAYVSRGWLRSKPAGAGRAHLYAADDLRRLRARRDARRGHAAVASAALNWGEPVLDSAITRIDASGPHYRGVSAVELASRGDTRFEAVAQLLWTGTLTAPLMAAAMPRSQARDVTELREQDKRVHVLLPSSPRPLDALSAVVTIAGILDDERHTASMEAELQRAPKLLRRMAAGLSASTGQTRNLRANHDASIAELACAALGAGGDARRVRLLEQMLILCADHELNVSTFAVRVTASGGADLYACVTAGLCALSGRWHGGLCDRIEALLQRCPTPADAKALVRERLRLGEHVPGFGHPLYPAGDPRGSCLLDTAQRLAASKSGARTRKPELVALRTLIDAMARAGHRELTLDLGLVAASCALGLPPGSATALFALGRTAGWIAHTLEQRENKVLLRPRARYVGALGSELHHQ